MKIINIMKMQNKKSIRIKFKSFDIECSIINKDIRRDSTSGDIQQYQLSRFKIQSI